MMGGNPRPRRDIGWYKSSIHEVHSVRVSTSEQQHGAGVVDQVVQEAETPDEAEPEQVRAQDEQQRDKEGAEGRAGHDGRGVAYMGLPVCRRLGNCCKILNSWEVEVRPCNHSQSAGQS